jgi:hypothetical protein
MGTGNRQQVPGAGAVEHFPLRGRDAAFFTDRQRHQNAGLGLPGTQLRETIGDALAVTIQWIALSHCQTLRGWLGADVAAGDDATGVQPAFVVEATGIAQATRRFQPHRKPPAVTDMQRRRRLRSGGFRSILIPPGQAHPTGERNVLPSALDLRQFKLKTDAAPGPLRQAGNPALHPQIDAF